MANILILEDEDDLGELYRLALGSEGHEVLGVFADPAGALAGLPGSPEVVIVDERLGLRSGSSFIPRLRAAFPGAKLLLVSADPDAVREARERGFDEARQKPVSLRELTEHVRDLLEGRRGVRDDSGLYL